MCCRCVAFQVISRTLIKHGHNAMEAQDGSQALQLFEESLEKEQRFAAIFIDSVMPIMDGECVSLGALAYVQHTIMHALAGKEETR